METINLTENQAQCKFIADTLEQIAEGRLYLCPECDEFFNGNDSKEDTELNTICPRCGKVLETDYLESVSMLDYFENCYNLEYRIDPRKEYKSVQLMVACGGPNIYVDTSSAQVELYWWGDGAKWPLSSDTVAAIDEAFEELWNC